MKTKVFYHVNTTSESSDSDVISLGLVAVIKGRPCQGAANGGCACLGWCRDRTKTMYCESTDFKLEKCNDWTKDNVVSKLLRNQQCTNVSIQNSANDMCSGDSKYVSEHLKEWLFQFESIEFWGTNKSALVDLIADWETIPYCRICNEYNKEGCEKGNCIGNYVRIGKPKHLSNISTNDFYDLPTLLKVKESEESLNTPTENSLDKAKFYQEVYERVYNK
jgi:hypothetical protein